MAFVVVDDVCEANLIVGVFSTRKKAKAFVTAHKGDRHQYDSRFPKYESLRIEECELDPL